MDQQNTANSTNSTKTVMNRPPSALQTKVAHLKSKFYGAYYGHPIKDMKLIVVTGSTGKVIVARFLQEILKSAGLHSAVLASEDYIKTSLLHKFFNDAWKANNNFVIVTAPASSLQKHVFYDLPVTLAVITDFVPASLTAPTPEEYLKNTLEDLKPEIVVKNRDDAYFTAFNNFNGTKSTLTYGRDAAADIHIDDSTLYKKGTEAKITSGAASFTAASFLSGEPAISYMTAASASALALNISPDAIVEGLGNYTESN